MNLAEVRSTGELSETEFHPYVTDLAESYRSSVTLATELFGQSAVSRRATFASAELTAVNPCSGSYAPCDSVPATPFCLAVLLPDQLHWFCRSDEVAAVWAGATGSRNWTGAVRRGAHMAGADDSIGTRHPKLPAWAHRAWQLNG